MFSKILVANRGEIACRVIKTAHRLGIRTVAVHSAADAGARHVRLADEAILIGPPPARESYLDGERILAAARQSGAEAIHPGYGFLSENADFAEVCTAAGIVFIGPPASAIRAMGSKSAAKALMATAGVPLTPGYHGDEQDPEFLRQQAEAIGYPVLIKASAGGGGKGMRIVECGEDFSVALASCQREALAAFGCGQVLVEKYLMRPRHIEIQVFADALGHCVHLFERDCSVQRRHQKVLEEAPAPGMTPERRAAMGQAAVEAARAVGYVGAGTVEFIVDEHFLRDGRFYFMEMNTRLQVEHPVTEMISGQDLVEWQLRVAAGEPLPLTQAELEIHGHALEARIYAEDPARGFLPSTGKLVHFVPPQESRHVRVDSGVETGDEITPHYDPMLAKLIVRDENRAAALARMRQALADFHVAGVATNVAFLSRLVASPAFASADLDTHLIDRQRESLFPAEADPPHPVLFVAVVAELLREQREMATRADGGGDPWSPWNVRDAWRMNLGARRTLAYRVAGAMDVRRFEIAIAYERDGWCLSIGGERVFARGEALAHGEFAVELDDHRLVATVIALDAHDGARRHVFLNGGSSVLVRDDPLHLVTTGGAHGGGLTAPMPGKVIALLAPLGQKLEKGAPLLILEAMKMEHTIRAPQSGTVRAYCYGVGDQVAEGAELLDFAQET